MRNCDKIYSRYYDMSDMKTVGLYMYTTFSSLTQQNTSYKSNSVVPQFALMKHHGYPWWYLSTNTYLQVTTITPEKGFGRLRKVPPLRENVMAVLNQQTNYVYIVVANTLTTVITICYHKHWGDFAMLPKHYRRAKSNSAEVQSQIRQQKSLARPPNSVEQITSGKPILTKMTMQNGMVLYIVKDIYTNTYYYVTAICKEYCIYI